MIRITIYTVNYSCIYLYILFHKYLVDGRYLDITNRNTLIVPFLIYKTYYNNRYYRSYWKFVTLNYRHYDTNKINGRDDKIADVVV